MVDKIWYNMEELIGGSEERVLIETYWNVNMFSERLSEAVISINRNILECKYRKFKFLTSCCPVLIETYWNVNVICNSSQQFFNWY